MASNEQQQLVTKNPRFIRWPEVKTRVGYSRSQVHSLIKQGRFPAPCKLGARASGWLESAIDEWIDSRISASQATAEKTGI
jgi:prophage regulatory protein